LPQNITAAPVPFALADDERMRWALRLWHIASFRSEGEVGRYRGMADTEEGIPNTLD